MLQCVAALMKATKGPPNLRGGYRTRLDKSGFFSKKKDKKERKKERQKKRIKENKKKTRKKEMKKESDDLIGP